MKSFRKKSIKAPLILVYNIKNQHVSKFNLNYIFEIFPQLL